MGGSPTTCFVPSRRASSLRSSGRRRGRDPGRPLHRVPAFSVGLGDHAGEGIVANAMRSPAYVSCRRFETASLRQLEATDTLAPGTTYLRYWHGYAVLTRPSVGIVGVAGTRWIAFALLALTAGGMAAAVKRAFGGVRCGAACRTRRAHDRHDHRRSRGVDRDRHEQRVVGRLDVLELPSAAGPSGGPPGSPRPWRARSAPTST